MKKPGRKCSIHAGRTQQTGIRKVGGPGWRQYGSVGVAPLLILIVILLPGPSGLKGLGCCSVPGQAWGVWVWEKGLGSREGLPGALPIVLGE